MRFIDCPTNTAARQVKNERRWQLSLPTLVQRSQRARPRRLASGKPVTAIRWEMSTDIPLRKELPIP